jgi:hypothetical protein
MATANPHGKHPAKSKHKWRNKSKSAPREKNGCVPDNGIADEPLASTATG